MLCFMVYIKNFRKEEVAYVYTDHPHGSHSQWVCSAGEHPANPTPTSKDSEAPPAAAAALLLSRFS